MTRVTAPELLLCNARVPAGADRTIPSDVLISGDGRILEIAPRIEAPGITPIDLGGSLIAPGLIDMHQHLDKSSTLAQAPNADGTLMGAIQAFREYSKGLEPQDILARAQVTLDKCIDRGTCAIRSHVNVDHELGLKSIEAITQLRADNRDRIHLQIVAFATSSAARGDPEHARHLLEGAIAAGADCVGGTPNLAPDPGRYIEMLLDVAERHDRLVDVHIDETLDPEARWFDVLVHGTRQRGMGGRVVASHVCSLGALADDEARRSIDAAAAAGVGVCTLPAANLFLQGREQRGLVPRGLTRVRDMLDAGIPVATASDNIHDAFVPVGSGDTLEIARWTLLAAHLLQDAGAQAFDMITRTPAGLMGLEANYGLRVGAWADLVVSRSETISHMVAGDAVRRAVLHRGRLVAGAFDAL